MLSLLLHPQELQNTSSHWRDCLNSKLNFPLIYCCTVSPPRVEYFYFSWDQGSQLNFFLLMKTIKNSLFGFNSNHGKEGKTRYYVIQCRFSEFLTQLSIKNAFLGVPCRNIALFGVHAGILLTWDQGVPGFSCRAIFGVREEILIFQRNIHLCLRQ